MDNSSDFLYNIHVSGVPTLAENIPIELDADNTGARIKEIITPPIFGAVFLLGKNHEFY